MRGVPRLGAFAREKPCSPSRHAQSLQAFWSIQWVKRKKVDGDENKHALIASDKSLYGLRVET
jgi:hypothetical protein